MGVKDTAPRTDAPTKAKALGERPSISTTSLVRRTHTPELVIALCGPIGTPLQAVAEDLQDTLSTVYGYEVETIRMSAFIERYSATVPATEYERVKALIDAGNRLRQQHGSTILADLAIREIAQAREKAKGDSLIYSGRRICHIINSIKNSDELEALRLVYRDMLYCIGVFAPMQAREAALTERGMTKGQIYELVDKDSGEELQHGQSVRKTFPKADYFLRTGQGDRRTVRNRLDRFVKLAFRLGVETPTTAESAMYHAASAAVRSACLSRQVGAALTCSDGMLLSVGWNDVPRFGGGLYPEASGADHRCYSWKEKCHNDAEKEQIAKQVATDLVRRGFVADDKVKDVADAILESRVGQLIEFSRAVHAEMHAILSAKGDAGSRIRGGHLYCTTYPCHSCARHIVAAGISHVYYIEPYPKSLALKLHSDVISEDQENSPDGRVRVLPYDGIAPTRFLAIFSMSGSERKQSGKLVRSVPSSAAPKYDISLESVPT